MAVRFSRSSSELTDPVLVCRAPATPEEFAEYVKIRHAVFVEEQGLFELTDQDEFDRDPATHHVVGCLDGRPVGTVRLYPLPPSDEGEALWKGDRLAVLPRYRHLMLGAPLVRHAVATAAAAGGSRMIAFVQLANVTFFRRLGWSAVGEPVPYVGVPHQRMSIDLTR